MFTHRLVLGLTAVLWLTDAVKPPTVDDAAYVRFAEQIARHPLDPYGFELHWWARPKPAMQVLAPPVVPYWLAASVAVFGPDPLPMKLSLPRSSGCSSGRCSPWPPGSPRRPPAG